MAKWTPCDEVGDDGLHHCPFEDTYTGYESEMCRVCCGLGVDEDTYDDYSYEDYEEEDEEDDGI